jgi:hypothetical protein
MESGAKILVWLSELAQQLPSMITILVCMVLVIARWKRHPKVSLLAAIGLFLLLVHGPFFALIYAQGPSLFLGKNYTSEEMRNLFLVLGLIFNSTRVIAFAPLLAAIFIGRSGSH